MSEPFLAEIRLFSFNFAPKGWAQCNGQLLPINQNQALFALLGTTYGGDGRVNFALPDLRGRVPLHSDSLLPSPQPGQFLLGQRAGEETHALTVAELPAHTHAVIASPNVPDQAGAVGNLWPNGGGAIPYADSADTTMAATAIAPVGASQGHENRPPFLVINLCIALQGIFPSLG